LRHKRSDLALRNLSRQRADRALLAG
jgi:hypothetical protein